MDRLRLVSLDTDAHLASFADDVRAGLTASPKRLSCRYFYDEAGSQLFEEICELPEYYLTRTERGILERCAGEIASLFPGDTALVELGSGSAVKTRLLIEAFLGRHGALRYIPIDISQSILEESSLALLGDYPGLEILGIAAEYRDGLRRLAAETGRPKLVLWLGSNVGNLDRPEAAAFLLRVRETMTPRDRLLMGVDMRKDRATLEAAYDDARGVTARFNLNLLERINRELGGGFDLRAFRHRAVYNEEAGRIEMYLRSLREQRVRIEGLDLDLAFAAGEAVHTENSYKYSPAELRELAAAAGFRLERQWTDERGFFTENLLAPDPAGFRVE